MSIMSGVRSPMRSVARSYIPCEPETSNIGLLKVLACLPVCLSVCPAAWLPANPSVCLKQNSFSIGCAVVRAIGYGSRGFQKDDR